VDALPPVDGDPLRAQPGRLDCPGILLARQRDPAVAADDPMPGQARAGGQRAQGPTYTPGCARVAEQSRHLAIGRDPPPRDPAHHRVHPLEEADLAHVAAGGQSMPRNQSSSVISRQSRAARSLA
jgi:hypothetical protein